MSQSKPEIAVRFADAAAELAVVEPLWNALQEHHASLAPSLAGRAPRREMDDAWRDRRAKYERWLEDPETFFAIAESGERPVGYAFVTVGPGYASWQTGERLAEVETLAVLSGHRGRGVGTALLDAVADRLRERGIDDIAITTVQTNVDSHRFYERHGFAQSFVIYYRKGDPASMSDPAAAGEPDLAGAPRPNGDPDRDGS